MSAPPSRQGGRLVFWRLAVKPGRPAAMGVVARQCRWWGLPGNPVAAVVTFLHLARPLVLRLAGAAPEPLPRFPAQAAFPTARRPAGGNTCGCGWPRRAAAAAPRNSSARARAC